MKDNLRLFNVYIADKFYLSIQRGGFRCSFHGELRCGNEMEKDKLSAWKIMSIECRNCENKFQSIT